MSQKPPNLNPLKRNTQNIKTTTKSSFWKLLCPCLSSKNSDSDGDDKMKNSYMREEFYQEKTNNEQNVHEETQTNLPMDFQIPAFYAQKHTNTKNINQNPLFHIKNDTKSTSSNGIKFNVKRNNTLQGYLNENINPNIQITKQNSKQAGSVCLQLEQNSKFPQQKHKKRQLHGKNFNQGKNKQNCALQSIDFNKMEKDRKYLIHILKQLQKMSGTTDYAFLKNGQDSFEKIYPINLFQENKLIVIGDKKHTLLTKVTSAKLYPSTASVKRLKESLQNKEANSKFVKKDSNFNTALDRYWERRYFLFEKFDEGIQLDEQSWYSVSPQSVADYISSRINVKNTLLDAFCGAGGDSLKLAGSCANIISNDIDQVKLKCLLNNSKIYDVQNITLSNSDFFKLDMKVDAVYLAPPWGGPDYFKIQSFHPQDFEPKLTTIIQKAFTLSTNVFFLLPINTNVQALAAVINQKICKVKNFKPESCSMRIEKLFYNDTLKFLLVMFGDSSVISDIKLGEELCFIYDLFREDDQTYFKHKKLIRKIREEYGMVNLLNFVFESQNFGQQQANNKNWTAETMIEKFEKYLLKNNLIDEKTLTKIKQEQQMEYEYDLKHRQQKNKRLKEKKIRKFLQKQGKQLNEGENNQEEKFEQGIDSENAQIPLSQIVKKAHNQNNENLIRKETFESNHQIQSGMQESSQLPRRDSLRTVSMISEFHEDQLRNINQTQRMTTNSEFSARDSIHPIQKYDEVEVSIDATSRISQESGRMIPFSAQKGNGQRFKEQSGHRLSEPIVFGKKQEIKMKKFKACTVYQKGIVEQAHE